MKKNLKKLVALGLVATTGTTLLAGCGGSDKGGSKDGKVELVMSVWDSDQEPVMKQMAEAYSKENPNVTVKTQDVYKRQIISPAWSVSHSFSARTDTSPLST